MIPTVSVDQMRAVDRLMVDEMGITLPQMMENAGRALAVQARQMLGGDARGRRIVVLAGRGGNGGGGLAAARRLSIWGADVTIVLGQDTRQVRGVPAHQLAILAKRGVTVREPRPDGQGSLLPRQADLILDALIGYSLRGAPRAPISDLIRAANAAGRSVLALDLPSGLDGDTGRPAEPTMQAQATLTLALPKAGLRQPGARTWVGTLYLADISVPETVYRRLGLQVGPIFAQADIMRVDDVPETAVRGV